MFTLKVGRSLAFDVQPHGTTVRLPFIGEWFIDPRWRVSAINAVATGAGISDAMINELASTSGQSPAQVTQFIEQFHGAMEAQAADAIRKATGMSLDDFASLAQEHDPEGLQAAIRSHIMDRNTRGYVELAKQMTANLDAASPDEVLAACKASGIATRQLPSGRVVLTLPGRGQVEFRTAVRMNWINVGR